MSWVVRVGMLGVRSSGWLVGGDAGWEGVVGWVVLIGSIGGLC